jgi:hypothetical protein
LSPSSTRIKRDFLNSLCSKNVNQIKVVIKFTHFSSPVLLHHDTAHISNEAFIFQQFVWYKSRQFVFCNGEIRWFVVLKRRNSRIFERTVSSVETHANTAFLTLKVDKLDDTWQSLITAWKSVSFLASFLNDFFSISSKSNSVSAFCVDIF